MSSPSQDSNCVPLPGVDHTVEVFQFQDSMSLTDVPCVGPARNVCCCGRNLHSAHPNLSGPVNDVVVEVLNLGWFQVEPVLAVHKERFNAALVNTSMILKTEV